MTKKKVKLCRRFNNCVEAWFDTVVNKYFFKLEAENQVLNPNQVSVTNSFTDNTVVCDTVNIKELSANRVGPYDKDNSSVNCVGNKHIINQFH